MKQELPAAKTLSAVVYYLLLFLFPLFFLPLSQEFFTTGKLYMMFFGALFLIGIFIVEYAVTRQIKWQKKPYDNVITLFFVASALSILISSPNKVQALLHPVFGLVALFSFLVLYLFDNNKKNSDIKNTLVYISAIVVSLVVILFYFQPFKNAVLPTGLQFFKSPTFSLLGTYLDTVLFLGYVAVMGIAHLFARHEKTYKATIVTLVGLAVAVVAICFILFSFVKTKDSLILPPFNLSWYSAVETLKVPQTALFGVGVDNFSSMFTRIKDVSYNSSSLWQVGSFNTSRSMLLQIFTEMGIVGGFAFSLLLLQLIKHAFDGVKLSKNISDVFPTLYVVLVVLLFPPSLTLLFLIVVLMSGVGVHEKSPVTDEVFALDTGKIVPLYLTTIVLLVLFVVASGYFVGRSYLSEIYFKRSVDAFSGNNVKNVYDNMRLAVVTNPYIERFRINFSQTNLLIANNVASKAQKDSSNSTNEPSPANTNTLSEQDRQTISQAIQAAIEEAKATATLNPQKAVNWENLAGIYRNIINVAQGADSWTISAYQRAIVLDPQNPTYRIGLGGVLFSLKNYDEAAKLFEQAIAIKPDWANGYYNLAWASYQKQDYKNAVLAMQNTVALIDPKKERTDFDKASADLAEFKKMLPPEPEATKSSGTAPTTLSIPTPAALLEPKIKLPKDASPEAK